MKQTTVILWQTIIMAGLAFICVVLSFQNYALKHRMVPSQPFQIKLPQQGDTLSAISYRTLEGSEDFIDFNDKYHKYYIIAIFRPHCPACVRAFPFWEKLNDKLPETIEFIALTEASADDVLDVLVQTDANIRVGLADEDADLSSAMGINAVPVTIIAGTGGIVEESWGGPKDDDTLNKIFQKIGAITTGP